MLKKLFPKFFNKRQATEISTVNKPSRSKINYLSALAWLAGLSATFGLLTPEQAEMTKEVILVSLPPIIMLLRTFFTNK